jgi:hypothetical protein
MTKPAESLVKLLLRELICQQSSGRVEGSALSDKDSSMSWHMTGQMHEICNCNFLCPCWFDLTAEPDQGHCDSALIIDIEEGSADGVDLSGRRAILGLSFPHTFAEGNATVRIYVDSETSSEQQAALESIFSGQLGGPWEALGPLVSSLLPTQQTDIDITWGEQPSIKAGDFGNVTTHPLNDGAGNPARITGAVAMTAFQCEQGQPAQPVSSRWDDTDLGSFEPRSGMILPFNWQA